MTETIKDLDINSEGKDLMDKKVITSNTVTMKESINPTIGKEDTDQIISLSRTMDMERIMELVDTDPGTVDGVLPTPNGSEQPLGYAGWAGVYRWHSS